MKLSELKPFKVQVTLGQSIQFQELCFKKGINWANHKSIVRTNVPPFLFVSSSCGKWIISHEFNYTDFIQDDDFTLLHFGEAIKYLNRLEDYKAPVRFEEGKWYKLKNSKALVCFQGGDEGYGFTVDGTWGNHILIIGIHDWTLADQSEVALRLLEEAKRRYPIGTKFVSPKRNIQFTVYHNRYRALSSGNVLVMTNCDSTYGYLLYNGKWAEIVEEPKKININIELNPEKVIEYFTKHGIKFQEAAEAVANIMTKNEHENDPKPIEPNHKKWDIDWSKLPEEAKYIAQDKDGTCYWYDCDVCIDSTDDQWCEYDENMDEYGGFDGKYNGDWRDSKTRVNVWTDDWLDENGNAIPEEYSARAMDQNGECYAYRVNMGALRICSNEYWNLDNRPSLKILGKHKFLGNWKNSKDVR